MLVAGEEMSRGREESLIHKQPFRYVVVLQGCSQCDLTWTTYSEHWALVDMPGWVEARSTWRLSFLLH